MALFERPDDSPGERSDAEGVTADAYAEEDVPAEYREGGKRDGSLLTTRYLLNSTDWPYLIGTTQAVSKRLSDNRIPRVKVKGTRRFAYRYESLLALRDADARDEDVT